MTKVRTTEQRQRADFDIDKLEESLGDLPSVKCPQETLQKLQEQQSHQRAIAAETATDSGLLESEIEAKRYCKGEASSLMFPEMLAQKTSWPLSQRAPALQATCDQAHLRGP